MATDVKAYITTVTAGQDLNSDSVLYKALAIGGTIAGTPVAAVGLVRSQANDKTPVSVAYFGEMKANAGGAITAGALLTVTTSGWIITASDSRSHIGRALETAASGDLFRGLFNFITP